MQYLWNLEKSFLKDLVESFPEPRPAYTTISTVIRVLVKKKFIGYQSYGKIHEYYPLISREEYLKGQIDEVAKDYFSGSITELASFITRENDVDLSDLEEIRAIVDRQIERMKKKKS